MGASQQLTVTSSFFMLGTTGVVSLAAGDTLGVQLTTTGNDTVQANIAHLTVFLLFVSWSLINIDFCNLNMI